MNTPRATPIPLSSTGRAWLAGAWLIGIAGCATLPDASIFISNRDLQAKWDRMKADPTGLDRPLLVLDGWRQPNFSSRSLARTLRSLTGADESQVMAISYMFQGDMNGIADTVIDRVEKQWPSTDPDWTAEVDVVGFSMGGVVARVAAMERAESKAGKRLKVRRLFTLATPHRGAKLAGRIALDSAARDLRPGSDFLRRLDAALPTAPYELYCYAHTNDRTVGARNTAPPGREPIWTQGTLVCSHVMTRLDRRLLADIALHLRAEPPLAVRGSQPPRD